MVIDQVINGRDHQPSMKSILNFPLLLLIIIVLFSVIHTGTTGSEGKDTGDHEICPSDVLITEVCPAFDCEFVRIYNCNDVSVNLSGWSLEDGEGNLRLDGVTIPSRNSVCICSDGELVKGMMNKTACFVIGKDLEVIYGRFVLADKGDEVILRNPEGTIADIFVYGESSYDGEEWSGSPFPTIPRGSSAKRIDTNDTDTADDWIADVPGRSSLLPAGFSGWMEPIIWPDHALQVLYREIKYATRSIIISMYELGSSPLVPLLCEKSKNGLEISLMLEGQPVGGLSEDGKKVMWALHRNGVEIRLMKSYDGYRRYDYLHCKYAVFDGHRIAVMSENWVNSAFGSNRGWGVIIESKEFARYLTNLYYEDSNIEMLDVCGMDEILHAGSAYRDNLEGYEYLNCTKPKRYQGKIIPVISPDFSLQYIRNLIMNAERRLLIEQFYCDSFAIETFLPDLLNAAERGVDVRVLLDSSWFNIEENGDFEELLNSRSSLKTQLESRLVSRFHNFQMLHNKGMVIDDMVLISSINWCREAFLKNREVGVLLESRELADYIASIYEYDWKIDPVSPHLILTFPQTLIEGDSFWFDASASSDNTGISYFEWFVDGELIEGKNRSIVCLPLTAGYHLISVSAIDIYGNRASEEVLVRVLPGSGNSELLWLSLPLVISLPSTLIWFIRKKVKLR